MRKIFAIAAAVLFTVPSFAEAPGGPPAGFFPANMPNVGDLWIEFCGPAGFFCEDREAKVWGQVCDSSLADDTVNGDPIFAHHMDTPSFKHYVGWRCGHDGELITPEKKGFYNDGKFVELK